MNNITNKLITFTEIILTKRKRHKYIKKEKQKAMNPVLDWILAFIWAAGVVLLLNQYLFQAYVIPTSSMENTLLVKDRLFVNKFIYGPEILPGIGKLPGFAEPTRSDVIIFENPEYISRGTLFDLTQRIVFMLTLSLVDLDKDPNGDPAVHFLIKRGIAGYDDIVKLIKGEVYIKPKGENIFYHEDDFNKLSGIDYYHQRSISPKYYDNARDFYRSNIFSRRMDSSNVDYPYIENQNGQLYDGFECTVLGRKFLTQFDPKNLDEYSNYTRFSNGIYVPDGWILPLGDNRDRSNDGRYFGPVRKSEILGQASIKFWPIPRIGRIK
jgi:signal peptidase I